MFRLYHIYAHFMAVPLLSKVTGQEYFMPKSSSYIYACMYNDACTPGSGEDYIENFMHEVWYQNKLLRHVRGNNVFLTLNHYMLQSRFSMPCHALLICFQSNLCWHGKQWIYDVELTWRCNVTIGHGSDPTESTGLSAKEGSPRATAQGSLAPCPHILVRLEKDNVDLGYK